MKTFKQTAWVLVLLMEGTGMCQEAVFSKTHLMAKEGKGEKLVEVGLRFSNTSLALTDKKTSQMRLEIPYTAISAISYEKASRHRTQEGGALAAVSLGGGLILMATKTESHWLEIDYDEGSVKRAVVLQIHKDEVDAALAECEARYGKRVERLSAGEHKINVTADSHNIDEMVAYPPDKVRAALKPAFEKYACSITKEKGSEIECKRAKTGYSEVAGVGGERIIAKFEEKGGSTRVRIETERGFNSKYAKKNWSAPVFKEMMATLNGSTPKG